MTGASILSMEEKLRDIRAMIRRANGIEIAQTPAVKAPRTARNLSVRVPRQRQNGPSRSTQLTFNTSADITGLILREARVRQCSVSMIVDGIVTGAHERGLWGELLASISDPVASASNRNHNNE